MLPSTHLTLHCERSGQPLIDFAQLAPLAFWLNQSTTPHLPHLPLDGGQINRHLPHLPYLPHLYSTCPTWAPFVPLATHLPHLLLSHMETCVRFCVGRPCHVKTYIFIWDGKKVGHEGQVRHKRGNWSTIGAGGTRVVQVGQVAEISNSGSRMHAHLLVMAILSTLRFQWA